jgi:hypothetical protein
MNFIKFIIMILLLTLNFKGTGYAFKINGAPLEEIEGYEKGYPLSVSFAPRHTQEALVLKFKDNNLEVKYVPFYAHPDVLEREKSESGQSGGIFTGGSLHLPGSEKCIFGNHLVSERGYVIGQCRVIHFGEAFIHSCLGNFFVAPQNSPSLIRSISLVPFSGVHFIYTDGILNYTDPLNTFRSLNDPEGFVIAGGKIILQIANNS